MSAAKADGLQRTVLLLALTKPARLYLSNAILAKYSEVLARSEFKSAEVHGFNFCN
jgi:hypothetical protein